MCMCTLVAVLIHPFGESKQVCVANQNAPKITSHWLLHTNTNTADQCIHAYRNTNKTLVRSKRHLTIVAKTLFETKYVSRCLGTYKNTVPICVSDARCLAGAGIVTIVVGQPWSVIQ